MSYICTIYGGEIENKEDARQRPAEASPKGNMSTTKNPLFIEFYPHTNGDCYKIDLPWTKYRRDTLVLCDVAKGIAHAKRLARQAIAKHLAASLAEPILNNSMKRVAVAGSEQRKLSVKDC